MWGMILKPLVGVAGDVVKGFVEKKEITVRTKTYKDKSRNFFDGKTNQR